MHLLKRIGPPPVIGLSARLVAVPLGRIASDSYVVGNVLKRWLGMEEHDHMVTEYKTAAIATAPIQAVTALPP